MGEKVMIDKESLGVLVGLATRELINRKVSLEEKREAVVGLEVSDSEPMGEIDMLESEINGCQRVLNKMTKLLVS